MQNCTTYVHYTEKLLVSKKEKKFSKKAAALAAAFLVGPKGGCMAADSNKNS